MSGREERPGTGEPEVPDERPGQLPAIPPEVYCAANIAGVSQAVRHHDVIAPTQAGDTLLVIVSTNNANANVTGVTDSKGNRYTLPADGVSTVTPTTWSYRCEGKTGGPVAGQPTAALTLADQVTVTCNGNVSMNVGLLCVHIPGLGPVDQRTFQQGAGTTTMLAAVTPQAPGEFAIALAANQTGGGEQPPYEPPFTRSYAGVHAQVLSCAYVLATGAAGQPVTCRAVLAANTNWRIQLWAFYLELLITTDELPPCTEGRAYPPTTLEGTGGRPPLTWALASGVLPAGLTLTPAGLLSGNLAAGIAGNYPVTFRVTDAAGTATTRAYTIVVRPAVRVATEALPGGNLGSPYSARLEAAGGAPPYGWVTAGLPPGLALAGDTIEGVPTAGGDFTVEATVTDAEGGSAQAALPLFIDAPPPLVITTPGLPGGQVGSPYLVTLEAEGGVPPYDWEASGLPPGLELTGANISGLPTVAGEYQVAVDVTDDHGTTTQATFGVEIAAQEGLRILTTSLPPAMVGIDYEAWIEVTGGLWPYQGELTGLPPGLYRGTAPWPATRMVIHGAPEETGTWTVAGSVTDWEGASASAEWPLLVTEPPEPPGEPVYPPRLVPVVWAGRDLNAGDRDDGTTLVVTEVEGWYGTPTMEGHDLDRALTDGAVFGAKVTAARVVTLTGAAAGPHAALVEFARDLAALAVARQPAPLSIAEHDDPAAPMLTAQVRAGQDRLSCDWRGRSYLAWQVALTAADPRLYEDNWREAALSFVLEGDTGRDYPLAPPRFYAEDYVPNTARLVNPGNVPAPVLITYLGPMGESRLSDGTRSIRLAPLAEGQQVMVESTSLLAVAPGGATRASYILPSSQPLWVRAGETALWRLYGAGRGRVLLAWRGAWT